jgi:hypothetical protein
MSRIRLVALLSGIGALLVAPALAAAQESDPSGQPPAQPEAVTPSQTQTQQQQKQQKMQHTQPQTANPYGGDKYGTSMGGSMYGGSKYGVSGAERQPTAGYEEQPTEAYAKPAPSRREPLVPGGLVLSVGGGINDFAGQQMRNLTELGGEWEARVLWGSRFPLGIEVAYVGTAQNIRAVGLDPGAVLVSNGIEGMGRLNIGTYRFQPYIVGGVAWQHFSVTNKSFNVSDVDNSDDVVAIPFGGGFAAYIGDGFMVDARFVYRATYHDDLIQAGSPSAGGRGLANWCANLKLGYEF